MIQIIIYAEIIPYIDIDHRSSSCVLNRRQQTSHRIVGYSLSKSMNFLILEFHKFGLQ